jgi:hypothetical protein
MKLMKSIWALGFGAAMLSGTRAFGDTVESVNYECQLSAEQRCINDYHAAWSHNQIHNIEWTRKIQLIQGIGSFGQINLLEVCKSALNPFLSQCRVTAKVPTTEQTQKMIDDMKKSFAEEIAKVLEKQREEVAGIINGAKKE